MNAPVQRDPAAGTAFRGRSYRLNGTRNNTSEQARANPQTQQPNSDNGAAFRGRGYRLGGQ